MAPLTSRPTDDELEKMVTHVLYEVDMFRSRFARWRSLRETHPDWNPVLESSLLHFRVLRDFFLSSARKCDDDVLAADYVTSAQWNPTAERIFAETKEEIDKRLAHLTTRRLQPPMIWKRGEMESAIERLIASFKRSLSPPASGWFARLGSKRLSASAANDESVSTETVIKYNH
jgi:hypothetical protein